jgi:hypothetical protein
MLTRSVVVCIRPGCRVLLLADLHIPIHKEIGDDHVYTRFAAQREPVCSQQVTLRF